MDDQFIITPTENTVPAALHTVQALAVAAGCPCVFTTPEEHDARIAYTEQLPQLLAAVYVQNEQAPMHRGFDGQACRAVASPAGQEISALQMLQNRDNLVLQLQQTEQRLALLQQMLQNAGPEQLAAFLRDGQSSFSQYFQ